MSSQFSYSNRTVLVTGGTGFIGSALCAKLCDHGANVHAISRNAHKGHRGNITWWLGDIADSKTVRRIFTSIKPTIVFHLASEVTGSRATDVVLPTLYSNLLGAVNVLKSATELGCSRIIMTGSLEEPDEFDPNPVPCSPYAAAKWAASAYARMYHNLFQTPVAIARLFMVYGPGQRDLRKLVPYVILSLLNGDTPLLSSGKRPVDWIYIDDVVNGLLASGIAHGVDGNTFDLGSGSLVTVKEVVETLCKQINTDIAPHFGAIPERPMERVRMADIGTAKQLLDWTPMVPLTQGIKNTVDWYSTQLKSSNFK